MAFKFFSCQVSLSDLDFVLLFLFRKGYDKGFSKDPYPCFPHYQIINSLHLCHLDWYDMQSCNS